MSTGPAKAIAAPSGRHTGVPAPSGRVVSCSGSPPFAGSSHSWGAASSEPRRNAMLRAVRRPGRRRVGLAPGELPWLMRADLPQRAHVVVGVAVGRAQDVHDLGTVGGDRRRLGYSQAVQVVDALASGHSAPPTPVRCHSRDSRVRPRTAWCGRPKSVARSGTGRQHEVAGGVVPARGGAVGRISGGADVALGVDERGRSRSAGGSGIRPAARAGRAARRRPPHWDRQRAACVSRGGGFEQVARVGMLRVGQHLLGRAGLDDATEVHHGDDVAQVAHHREVVRDEQHRQSEFGVAGRGRG